MSIPIAVTPPPTFDPHSDANSINQNWTKWLNRFGIFAAATGCKDDKQKRQLFLHTAGPDVQDIFMTLGDTGESCKAAIDALTAHFTPLVNVTFQRHQFRQQEQNEGENIANFVTRLRTFAATCDFGDNLNDFIKDQAIDKCRSKHLKTKLLAERNLTLQRLLEIALAREASENQATQIASETERRGPYPVNAVQQFRHHRRIQSDDLRHKLSSHHRNRNTDRSESEKTADVCSKCGFRGHRSVDCRCSRNIQCYKCGKVGHFSSVCRSGSTTSHSSVSRGRDNARLGSKNRRHSRTPHRIDHKRENVRFVEETGHSDSSYSDEYDIFSVDQSAETMVFLEGEPVAVLVDSGAAPNIITTNVASRLQHRGIKVEACRKLIRPFASSPIEVENLTRIEVRTPENQSTTAEFLIVPGAQTCLLGRELSEKLNLLKLGVNRIESAETILERYPGIADGIGCLKGQEVTIHIDHSVPPVARKHNRVAFHLRPAVESELKRLENADIVERVTGPTEWISPIVATPKPKNPKEIRLCIDMREANQAVIRTRHVTPTVEELITDLNGSSTFSKIDLRSGYHQLVLAPQCRYITTFSTHVGLFRYKRLIFGLSSAAEVFQHTIQTVIEGIQGAKNVSDDIIIFGKTPKDHDRALHQTLKRLHEAGLTVNEQKCEFHRDKIEFFGYIFSSNGISPDPKKVQALHDAKPPQNPSEVRSLLGMAQYIARFIPDYSTISEPLRSLTRQDHPWKWGSNQESAFLRLKAALSEATTLAYFDANKQTVIQVDASPYGIAGILTQDERPVVFASRSLTDVETRYSQTEREALAVVWACEHYNIYIAGKNFTMVTDHRPLLGLWKKTNLPPRLARWSLRLQPYDMTLIYQPGKLNPADYMSRHPTNKSLMSSREEKIADEYVNFVAESSTPNALTLAEVKHATSSDPTLRIIMDVIQTGQWYNLLSRRDVADISSQTLIAYRNIKDDLCVGSESDIILKGNQLVIPERLQSKVIQLAHEGHQGISKTKSLLRSKVWFPGMDIAVEKAVRECLPCQANTNRINREPLKMSELPRGAWLNLSIDFCGPLPSGDYLLVLVDEYSRYPIAEVVRSTSAESTITAVEKIFSLFGYPEIIKSDNGPPFQGHSWKAFLKKCGIHHRKITPLWPRANAQAESFNKPLMKAIRAAHVQKKPWKDELVNFLRIYRTTPHSTTLFTPYKLLFNRDPKTKFPEVSRMETPQTDATVRSTDEDQKHKMKNYADKRNRALSSEIQAGDYVLSRQRRENKLSTPFNPEPLIVTETKGPMVTAQNAKGSTAARNSSYFRKIPSDQGRKALAEASCFPDESDPIFTDSSPLDENRSDTDPNPTPLLRRSTRIKRVPDYLKYYKI